MNKDFFKKENIHNAIWALIIALFAFIGGLVWQSFTGPERVIVEKDENISRKDTTITIIKFEGDSATINAIKNFNPQLSVKSSSDKSIRNTASIARPKIRLPNMVEGYIQKPLNTFASVVIPRLTYSKGEMIELELKIFDEETLKKISPLFIGVVKTNSEKSITQIWEEQFNITDLNNTIRFSSDFGRDEYELSVGFYLMDELHQKYPTRYSKRFKIVII
ncbi:hypothetical protein [Maribacter arenosus]|uniref:Uncharacterized protein n=1 Tax=Maribacter arenosus TaxID=1854708 RepID=A0ABR7VEJ8_9FLAO|nr:hypothetical protein [Maribacter arenosus]MBD0852068.1 hypothetical protein [Maribacter arenosus]